MTNVNGVSTLSANSHSANVATRNQITALHNITHTADELRALAEKHPGMVISHFVTLHKTIFVQRDNDSDTWTLRIAAYNACRPTPYSLAAENWQREIEMWRSQFHIPPAAVAQYDPDWTGLHDTRGYAVILRWRELNGDAQPELL